MRNNRLGMFLKKLYLVDPKDTLFDIGLLTYSNSQKGYLHLSKSCRKLNKNYKKDFLYLYEIIGRSNCHNCIFELNNINKDLYQHLELIDCIEEVSSKLPKDFKKSTYMESFLWLVERNSIMQKIPNSKYSSLYVKETIKAWATAEENIKKYYQKKYSKKIDNFAIYNILQESVKNDSSNINPVYTIHPDVNQNKKIVERVLELYRIDTKPNIKGIVDMIASEFPLNKVNDLAGNLKLRKFKEETMLAYLERYYTRMLKLNIIKMINELDRIAKVWRGKEDKVLVILSDKVGVTPKGYGALLRLMIPANFSQDGSSLYQLPENIGFSLVCQDRNFINMIAPFDCEISKEEASSIISLYQWNSKDTYGNLASVCDAVKKLYL